MRAAVMPETPRLALREMRRADIAVLSGMLCDPEVMHAYEHAFSAEEVRLWLDRQLRSYAEHGFGLWAVALKPGAAPARGTAGEMIGQCGLTLQECPAGRVLEVGYLFRKDHWGRGHAAEAARACRDYAFTALHAPEVFSIIRDGNAASQAVARKNGMTPQGVFSKRYYGLDMPHVIFSITRSAWLARKR